MTCARDTALPGGQTAIATKRFDRVDGLRIPMQGLAAFTGANFRSPGVLDYQNFLRATQFCTNDVRERTAAFQRAVFNVAFHNRDDHPKNFSYRMSADGRWTLAPAYDVTFCEGPAGYHQMDVMGEAMNIGRKPLLQLGEREADLSRAAAAAIIDQISQAADNFAATARRMPPGQITDTTLQYIQGLINVNVNRLR